MKVESKRGANGGRTAQDATALLGRPLLGGAGESFVLGHPGRFFAVGYPTIWISGYSALAWMH